MNYKEQYWIREYDSINYGYNETDAIYKSGGNTYQSKTEEEMNEIKEKIRKSKLGENNPNARRIKRVDVITGECDYFDTIIECARMCGIKNGKTSITTRLSGKITSPFKNRWLFEYCDK